MFTHHHLNAEQTYGSWLLPVVPLIGAAVPSAMLVEYWPTSMHLEILVLNYVLWGTGVVLAVMMIVLFYSFILWGALFLLG
jgi:tellurite resistance protein TehA-like permease